MLLFRGFILYFALLFFSGCIYAIGVGDEWESGFINLGVFEVFDCIEPSEIFGLKPPVAETRRESVGTDLLTNVECKESADVFKDEMVRKEKSASNSRYKDRVLTESSYPEIGIEEVKEGEQDLLNYCFLILNELKDNATISAALEQAVKEENLDFSNSSSEVLTGIKKRDSSRRIVRDFVSLMPDVGQVFLVQLLGVHEGCLGCIDSNSQKERKNYGRRIYDVVNALEGFGVIEVVSNGVAEFCVSEMDIAIGALDYCLDHSRYLKKSYMFTGKIQSVGKRDAMQRAKRTKKRLENGIKKHAQHIADHICGLSGANKYAKIQFHNFANIMDLDLMKNKKESRRRIYDLTIILETIGVLSKSGKSQWTVNWESDYLTF